MKERYFQAYRAFHEQGFIPIFVHDHFDSKVLIEASVAAGCTGIEYTFAPIRCARDDTLDSQKLSRPLSARRQHFRQ